MDVSGVPAAFAREASLDPARYALGGVAPSFAAKPATAAEAAAIVRACAADRLALVPWGGGVSLAGEGAPPRYDVALDLTGLDRVTVYDPDDFTVSAECGITVGALRATLAAHGQELPVEGAHAARATLGGVLAANAGGPRRLRFGAPRDRILGARFVTGDGVLAKSGGRVVKNVAGHAVHRLLAGSRGGLAVLLETSLKLVPHAPARVGFVFGCDAAALADPARWAGFPRREPAVLTVLGREAAAALGTFATSAPFTVVVGWEDDGAWIDACERFAREALGAPAQRTEGSGVPALWQLLTDAEEAAGPRLSFASAHNTPAALATLASRPLAAKLVFHAPSGRLHVWPAAEEAAALATELAALGFALTEARGLALPPAEPPVAIATLRAALRRALDPTGVLALGERWETDRATGLRSHVEYSAPVVPASPLAMPTRVTNPPLHRTREVPVPPEPPAPAGPSEVKAQHGIDGMPVGGPAREGIRRTWLPTLLFTPAMCAIAAVSVGSLWAVVIGVSTAVVTPMLWWLLVVRSGRVGPLRGAAIGAAIGLVSQLLPPLIFIVGFNASGESSSAGLAGLGTVVLVVAILGGIGWTLGSGAVLGASIAWLQRKRA